MKIRTVVLYHSAGAQAPDELDVGTAQYRVENVFLSNPDGNAALDACGRSADPLHNCTERANTRAMRLSLATPLFCVPLGDSRTKTRTTRKRWPREGEDTIF